MKMLTIAVIPWLKSDQPVAMSTVLSYLPSIVLMDGYELVFRLESERVIVEFREAITENVAHNSPTGQNVA